MLKNVNTFYTKIKETNKQTNKQTNKHEFLFIHINNMINKVAKSFLNTPYYFEIPR